MPARADLRATALRCVSHADAGDFDPPTVCPGTAFRLDAARSRFRCTLGTALHRWLDAAGNAIDQAPTPLACYQVVAVGCDGTTEGPY